LIRSMTGYGAAEIEGFKVEVRSLNHKYLDVSVRMPSYLMEYEMAVRKMVKDSFERGKIDVSISQTDRRSKKIMLDANLAREMYNAFAGIQKELSLPGSLDINFFAGYRELLVSEEPSGGSEQIFEALKEAVSKVDEMRCVEGRALEQELRQRLNLISERHKEIAETAKDFLPVYRDRLLKKVSELMSNAVPDEARLAQEMAFIAQKADITEEITRLGSHISQFMTFLSSGASVGRRLDFLCQEMNREANTIGSKIDDIAIINLGLDIKAEVERLREQVQNIQ
jgi:uncharacterized protein (TIGR00255 family)